MTNMMTSRNICISVPLVVVYLMICSVPLFSFFLRKKMSISYLLVAHNMVREGKDGGELV